MVTSSKSLDIYHRIEDGEAVCGPSRCSNTRFVERADLADHYRACRTCFQEGRRAEGSASVLESCPFCGAGGIVLTDHLPDCGEADDYFEQEGIAR